MKQFFTRFMVIAIGMIIFPAADLTAPRPIPGVLVSSDDQEPRIGA